MSDAAQQDPRESPSSAKAAARPGRVIEVAPERLAGWLDRFAATHGELSWRVAADAVDVSAPDGARVRCGVPFPPLTGDPAAAYGGLVEHATRRRTFGLLLVRRGGHAVGVVDGAQLVVSKVGSRHVQGRSAAGGWSQQRFARRRDNQAKAAYGAAADVAARILTTHAGRLDAVVTGGDRAGIAAVLADDRLRELRPLVVERVLAVADPRQRVLHGAAASARAVVLAITDPPSSAR